MTLPLNLVFNGLIKKTTLVEEARRSPFREDGGMADEPLVLWTAGHSNRTLESFIALLESAGIRTAVDIRSHPGSKRHPWFRRENLESSLEKRGIRYLWLKELGGRRKRRPGSSPHTALGDSAFRHYVDWMDSLPFQEGLERLLKEASIRRCAVFCAEKDPEHCHRRYLSDVLALRGVRVVHLIEADRGVEHALHPDLVPEEGRPIYSGRQGRLF